MKFLNPHTPVADEVVFRRLQGEGVEVFLNRTSLCNFMRNGQVRGKPIGRVRGKTDRACEG